MPSENLHILCRFIEICPHFCEQYQTLVKALQEKESRRKDNELFSEQELFALRMAGLITNCEGGLKDGIAECYHYDKLLAPHYRLKGLLNATMREADVMLVVDQAVQSALHDATSDLTILKTIAKMAGNVPDYSHYTLYLENRLHRHIGMVCKPQFDRHVGLLSDIFLAATPQEVVPLLMNKVLEVLVPRIQRNVASLLQGPTRLYIPLGELMQSGYWEEGFEARCFVFDMENRPIGITATGAIRLALACGYFTLQT